MSTPINDSFTCWLAGLAHYQYKDIHDMITEGQLLLVKPEPDNIYDRWAQAVWLNENFKLGYIPKRNAFQIGVLRAGHPNLKVSCKVIRHIPLSAELKSHRNIEVEIKYTTE